MWYPVKRNGCSVGEQQRTAAQRVAFAPTLDFCLFLEGGSSIVFYCNLQSGRECLRKAMKRYAPNLFQTSLSADSDDPFLNAEKVLSAVETKPVADGTEELLAKPFTEETCLGEDT